MGTCLNQKYINNATFDNFSQINKEDNNNKDYKENNVNNGEGKKVEDKIQLSPKTNMDEKKNIISINDKFISYKIQSRYKSKFFNNKTFNTNNKSTKNNVNESQNFYNNFNDNCDNLIHFTYLSDKKGNHGGSTATNSNIK